MDRCLPHKAGARTEMRQALPRLSGTQELTGGRDRVCRPQEVLLTIGNVSALALGAGLSF